MAVARRGRRLDFLENVRTSGSNENETAHDVSVRFRIPHTPARSNENLAARAVGAAERVSAIGEPFVAHHLGLRAAQTEHRRAEVIAAIAAAGLAARGRDAVALSDPVAHDGSGNHGAA